MSLSYRLIYQEIYTCTSVLRGLEGNLETNCVCVFDHALGQGYLSANEPDKFSCLVSNPCNVLCIP